MFSRMKELINQINAANIAYHGEDAPIMSDAEFDELERELIELEGEANFVLSGSPTQKVGGYVAPELIKVKHTRPMLSAKKVHSYEEATAFAEGRTQLVSYKDDGLSIILRYQKGMFTQGITRGEDGVGEDITHSVRAMDNVPLTIPIYDDLEVRGEGAISWANYQALAENSAEPLGHPRNVVSGKMRKKDATACRGMHFEFFAFDVIEGMDYPSKYERLHSLERMGFDIVPHVLVQAGPGFDDRLENAMEMFHPSKTPYPVDGIIIEHDDVAYGLSLGATGHHENRLRAYKWEQPKVETTFTGLALATTRTGMVSFTAMFEDRQMENTNVNHAYLYNLSILRGFQLGVGDTIQVIKANGIIPQVVGNLTRSNTLELPTACPSCGEPLEERSNENGPQLYCDNPDCSAKQVRKFIHFCRKDRMNIKGLSAAKLGDLLSNGLVKEFADLYTLKEKSERIASLDGWGADSTSNLLDAIEASRKTTLGRFIASMGITEVGRSAGRNIEHQFGGDWAAFAAALDGGFDFTRLKDFGIVMQLHLYNWWKQVREEDWLRNLLEQVEFDKPDTTAPAENPFMGKTVVATGTLEHFTRSEITEQLSALGANPTGSVSKKTDYVIAGPGAGGKLERANELGVPVISEAQFVEMAGLK